MHEPAVIRFRKYNKNSDASNWYRAKLMLYFPWYDEDIGVAAFKVNGMTLHSAFVLGRSKYSGFQPLSNDKVNTLRAKLSKLMMLLIIEAWLVQICY